MLGWEFPPAFSGGLGIVTKEIVDALLKEGADLTLLLPQFIAREAAGSSVAPYVLRKSLTRYSEKINRGWKSFLKTIEIPTTIHSPYISHTEYEQQNRWSTDAQISKYLTSDSVDVEDVQSPSGKKTIYGKDLFAEIERFVAEVLAATDDEDFDLVHAHDWITAEAAVQLKLRRGMPFVLHIHATEFDRTGKTPEDSPVYQRERYAMHLADKVVTVSEYTKNLLVTLYDVPAEKITVVYNAYDKTLRQPKTCERWQKDKSKFWVLFIGRVTLQKGPDYFVDVARLVAERNPDVRFLIAGDGDMMPGVVEKIARHRLHSTVHCLGFLTPADRDALYLYTDACIIPSVSEPFGLTATEGIVHNSPLILSRTCGANELISHKLSVDFWDVEQMAEYVLALAEYPQLRRTLRKKAHETLPTLTWAMQAKKLLELYDTL